MLAGKSAGGETAHARHEVIGQRPGTIVRRNDTQAEPPQGSLNERDFPFPV